MNTTLGIVVPCYKEEEVLPNTVHQLGRLLEDLMDNGEISKDSFVLFVDDGSSDRTWSLIEEASQTYSYVNGLKLAKNVGHQNALLAGLFEAAHRADCTLSIDADLQDDISVIPEFIQKFHDGCDVVYGVRNKRDTDTWFKRNSAQAFYKIMGWFGVDIVYNHADFRLMSRRAVEALMDFKEVNLFLRGLVPLIGFKSDNVYYERKLRLAGESKYPLKKMIMFAMDGITSLSIKPIRFVAFIGFFMFVISFILDLYSLILKMTGHTETGWTSLILSIWTLGGIQLMAVGLVGEYIGKIYMETKARPRYIVEKYLSSSSLEKPMVMQTYENTIR